MGADQGSCGKIHSEVLRISRTMKTIMNQKELLKRSYLKKSYLTSYDEGKQL